MSWTTGIDWSTPAGVALKALFAELPEEREFRITLFGSSPLQLALEPTFLSADVDMFSEADDADFLNAAVKSAGLEKSEERLYVQVCVEWNFRTSPRWRGRAFQTQIGNVLLTLPHPIDLLIAKLHRLADKDLDAFRLVIARTGHPTEDEMRRELQFALGAGLQAGNALAERAAAGGWAVSMLPAPDGQDWNDVIRQKGRAA